MKIYNKQENKYRNEGPNFKLGDKGWINSSLIIHNS